MCAPAEGNSSKPDARVQQLVSSLSPDNFVVNNSVLHTAHSIFKRWRSKFRSDELFLEIKFVLDRFCQPFLQIFQRVDELLSSPTALPAPSDPKTLARSLLLCLQLFFDLNSQDIPEFFEDNQAAFMALLHKYLTWDRPELRSSEDDEEAGDLEKIKASICEIVELYSQRYQDVFPQMDQFVETVWKMVTALSSAQKYDIVSSLERLITALDTRTAR
jgi:exportin-2 (importin alpha re-exporter)